MIARLSYGAITDFPLESNLNSLAGSDTVFEAKPLGVIDLNGLSNVKFYLQISCPVLDMTKNPTVKLWLIESIDNISWTDGINPSSVTTVDASLRNAKVVDFLRPLSNDVLRWVGDVRTTFLEDSTRYITLV